jgi:hypothetical protein
VKKKGRRTKENVRAKGDSKMTVSQGTMRQLKF